MRQNLGIAWDGIRANKLRSSLTMLGMIIGVAAVIVLMSIGTGTQASITSRISSLGSNLVFVRPGGAPIQGGVRQAQGSAGSLTFEDAQVLAAPGAVPGALAVAPETATRQQLVAGNLNTNTNIRGVDEAYLDVRNYEMAEGEFFTATQLSTRALVVVLGSNTAATLFPEGDAVGKNLRINRLQFRVVGTLVSKGGSGFGNEDDVAMVPITTSLTRLSQQRTNQGQRSVSTINIKAENDKSVGLIKESVAAILRERHRLQGEDDFTVTSQEDTLATLNQVTGVMTAFLGSIAGISLLVGGIGIMNIMLVSVTERTREIGIRKAVGAKRRDILAQFLVEATMMSLVGGGLGLGIGILISRLVNGMQLNNQPLQTVVSPDIAILSVTVSAAVGLFFGIYPAVQASKLNPIQALRYE
ncbi:MAG: FtsX-like permease family protein [Dehalococcoidia bacterium]|nr:FtsX-like permease family protein [Dehalococcoidia bacterium]